MHQGVLASVWDFFLLTTLYLRIYHFLIGHPFSCCGDWYSRYLTLSSHFSWLNNR